MVLKRGKLVGCCFRPVPSNSLDHFELERNNRLFIEGETTLIPGVSDYQRGSQIIVNRRDAGLGKLLFGADDVP